MEEERRRKRLSPYIRKKKNGWARIDMGTRSSKLVRNPSIESLLFYRILNGAP
jgi:hypothetical protein